eukprot:3497280-Rhodomonas_salina.1
MSLRSCTRLGSDQEGSDLIRVRAPRGAGTREVRMTRGLRPTRRPARTPRHLPTTTRHRQPLGGRADVDVLPRDADDGDDDDDDDDGDIM